jgi:SAM-dependent methyltransferase
MWSKSSPERGGGPSEGWSRGRCVGRFPSVSASRRHLPVPGRILVVTFLLLAACREAPSETPFPDAGRDVAPVVSDRFSTEEARDRIGEAEQVMTLAGVKAGMSVADVGAGEGYYTVRLSPIVGRDGRVLAQDISAETRELLSQRVQREGLDNVAVRLGEPSDPKLPANSFDRILLVHMYHEVTDPYAFLWNLRTGLKQDGEVIVVDADRAVKRHGIPPQRLKCELAALGLRLDRFQRLPGGDSYFAAFKPAAARPAPGAIKPCAEGAA